MIIVDAAVIKKKCLPNDGGCDLNIYVNSTCVHYATKITLQNSAALFRCKKGKKRGWL